VNHAPIRIRAGWVVDGLGGNPERNSIVTVADGRISAIEPAAYASEFDLDYSTGTLMPGFIDVHAHFTFDLGTRTYEQFMAEESDDELVELGVENCRLHALSGVTSARDAGSRGDTALRLRRLTNETGVVAPFLQVSGPPITTRHGHFWFCGGEAEGSDEVRELTRRLLAQGVDFIKVMASGGGTRGTDSNRAAFTADEIKAAVSEAHGARIQVMAHCLSADSVVAALDAGVDEIEHINFLQPDGSRFMSDEIADRIAASGVFVSPTIQTGFRQLKALEELSSPSESQLRELQTLRYKLETKLAFVATLHRRGAQIVAGTDALGNFGDYAIGLELLVKAGLTPLEAVTAATSRAAKAIGRFRDVGTIEIGKQADLIVVEGDVSHDVSHCANVVLVIRAGLELFGQERDGA
jgi:imidazolonepropionase-like amidohydrolase